MLPAEHRDAVVVVQVERRRDLLVRDIDRAVLDPAAPLLDDDAELRAHVLLGHAQIDHTVCLELHDAAQAVLGHALVVDGRVLVGDGVVAPAKPRDHAGELARARACPSP